MGLKFYHRISYTFIEIKPLKRPVNNSNSTGFLDDLSQDNRKKGHRYTTQTEIKLFGLITQEI